MLHSRPLFLPERWSAFLGIAMSEIAFGIKLGVGCLLGSFMAWRISRFLRTFILFISFTRAGFTSCVEGWLSKDAQTDYWILWDVNSHRMLRSRDCAEWQITAESIEGCLRIGREYKALWSRRIAQLLRDMDTIRR
jgi:hypothetical protein